MALEGGPDAYQPIKTAVDERDYICIYIYIYFGPPNKTQNFNASSKVKNE